MSASSSFTRLMQRRRYFFVTVRLQCKSLRWMMRLPRNWSRLFGRWKSTSTVSIHWGARASGLIAQDMQKPSFAIAEPPRWRLLFGQVKYRIGITLSSRIIPSSQRWIYRHLPWVETSKLRWWGLKVRPICISLFF